jgi:hypothetical protein
VLVKAEELPAAPSPLPPENLDSDELRIKSQLVTALNTKEKRLVPLIPYNRDFFAFKFLVLKNYNSGVPSRYSS